MVSNPSTTVILKPLSLSNLISLSSKSKIPFCNPQVRRVSTISPICRSSSSSNSHIPTFIFGSKLSFKDLGRREIGFKQMGFDWFRVSAVSDGDEKRWPLLSWYLAALEKYPVLTKALTTALLNCIGDLICQLLIDKVSTVDLKRTLLFTFLGFVLVGPTLHFWYLNLSKMVTIPGATGVVLRLLLDQFLFSPIFIGVFLSSLVTLEGRPSQVVPKLQQEWFSAVLANWQLWIPFQFLNFQFVPQQFQVLAANVVALAWNVILSFKAHKEVVAK